MDPAETPVTIPVAPTVATAGLDDAQVYVNGAEPVAFELKDNVLPMQTDVPPEIAFATGNALIVTEVVVVLKHVVAGLVTLSV